MKKLFALLIALCMVLSLGTIAVAEEEIVLRFLDYEGSDPDPGFELRHKYIEENIVSKYPGLKIEYERVPFADMESKAITSFAGGVYYDLMIVNHPAIAQYYDAGMLLDLTDFMEADGIDFDTTFSASIANCGVFDGRIFSLPRDTDTRILAVNKTLFEEAGLEYPKTTEDILKCAEALTKDTDGDGVVDQFGWIIEASNVYHPTYELGQYLLGNGVQVFTQLEDGTYVAQLDTPEAKEYMEFCYALSKFGPEDFISYDGDKIKSLFCQGKLAMYTYGSWNLTDATIAEAVENGLEYDLITNPTGSSHSGASQGGYHYGISSQTKYPEICWEIVKMFCEPEKAAQLSYYAGGLPTVLEAYNYEPFNTGLYDVVAEQILSAQVPIPQISVTNEIVQELWFNAWMSAILDEVSIEDALAMGQEEITAVLEEFMEG